MSDLESRLHLDGWEVRPAALAELPALLDRVSSVDEPDRLPLLEILARVAATGEQSPARVPSGWAEAWARGRERLLPLLDEPELRGPVLRALGSGAGPAGARVLTELRARWDADQSRLDVVCTVAQFAESDPAAWEWLREVPVTTPQERFAIACALGLGFDEYVAGLRADMAPWLASVWKTPRFLYPWATWRYIDGDDWETHTALLVAAHQRDADLGLRRAEMMEIAYLLTRWRAPTEALVPLLVTRLDDPEEPIRRRAVLLLGWVRAAEHADSVRALVNDEGAGQAAVWALSRFGIVVPELAQRLHRFPPFVESNDEMFLPLLAGALSPLRDHADELLPAVLELLKDATGARRIHLLMVLNAWGRADLAPGEKMPPDLLAMHLKHCPLIAEERRDLVAAGRRMSCSAGWQAFPEDEAVREALASRG